MRWRCALRLSIYQLNTSPQQIQSKAKAAAVTITQNTEVYNGDNEIAVKPFK